jgi:UDP-N-acetylmuramoylalanine-D-glutamate ligase
VSRYRPELVAAEAAGVAVTTTMALWLVDHSDAPVLAITGTKGKSTTAALASAILRAGGRRVDLIGNIGVPVLDTYGQAPPDAYVVEVSSYQAADVTRSPGVVVLTSLAPDHLDWHGGIEAYYRDKLRLVEAGPSGLLAVSAANDEAVARTMAHPGRVLFGPTGRVRLDDGGWIEVDGTRLVDARRLRLPGRHNVWNLCGAIAGIVLLTGEVPFAEAVGAALDGFVGLPSRCQVLGQRDGRTYVDDALASNPFASATSIESFAGRSLTVIVGGADRGVDPGAGRPPSTGSGGGSASDPGQVGDGTGRGGSDDSIGSRPRRGGRPGPEAHSQWRGGPVLPRGADAGRGRGLPGPGHGVRPGRRIVREVGGAELPGEESPVPHQRSAGPPGR